MTITISKNKLYLVGLTVFLGFFLFTLYEYDGSGEKNSYNNISSDEVRVALAQEFGGAYREEVPDSGEVLEYDLVAHESEVEIIPGKKTKVWSYNSQIPGPEIRINLGDTLQINFTNNLPQETTIHWHGVRVPNQMDGVPGLTQEPIEPGEDYVYKFTPKDAGTFWFHPHVRGSEQLEKGLYGTLVVQDPQEKYDFDKTLVLDDWLLEESGQVYPRFNTMHDLAHDGRWGNVITVNGSVQPIIDLPHNKIGLIRLVNASNGRVYTINLSHPIAQIVAVDGMAAGDFRKLETFTLAPGNRLDLLIDTSEVSSDEVITLRDYFTRNTNILAQFSIEKDDKQSVFSGLEPNFIPEWEQAYELPVDKVYQLNAGRGMMNISWTINNTTWPTKGEEKFVKGIPVRLRFANKTARLHPMHLHGQFFKVISKNGAKVDEPFWRDTVLISSNETVDIVMLPLDTGQWLNHCHIQEHAEAGMMTSFEVVEG